MPHPKVSQSKFDRFRMLSTAFLCFAVFGCSDEIPTAPGASLRSIPSNARLAADGVPFREFFGAWSKTYTNGPIQTQIFGLDDRQDRQYVDWYTNETVLAFARAYPGHLYINGDEPDQWCMAPSEYAGMYHDFVTKIRQADPTARVAPAGFAEPNEKCCPDPTDEGCKTRMHSVSYAEDFYNAYKQRYGAPPRVDEWRFHDFGIAYASGDLAGWWTRIDKAAAWSVAHGAKMVLGGWGFHGWREPVPVFQEHLKQAMGRLMNDSRISGALYWSYEPWIESPRPLVNEIGGLTLEGQTYANPLTDVPAGLKLVGSPDGDAKLRWNNTTKAWAAEVEFFVQKPGASSFEYLKTVAVPELGADESPFVGLPVGDVVKARVRYYNAYGQAEWSPFSNAVLLAMTESDADQRKKHRNRPLFCFLQLC